MVPGKKIFISTYHPFKVQESIVVAGENYFRVAVNARQIEMVSDDKNDCQKIDNNVEAVVDFYDRYEIW